MKALISYKDWLLLNRGEIRPEVGDKIKTLTKGRGIINRTVIETKEWKETFIDLNTNKEVPIHWIRVKTGKCNWLEFELKSCYVEIDYTLNDAIKFAEWLPNRYMQQMREKTKFTTEELYNEFKQLNN